MNAKLFGPNCILINPKLLIFRIEEKIRIKEVSRACFHHLLGWGIKCLGLNGLVEEHSVHNLYSFR